MESLRELFAREAKSPADIFLELLSDPFSSQSKVRMAFLCCRRGQPSLRPFSQLQESALFAAIGSSIGTTAAIAICFSLLRPYNNAVYAPKLKHADEKHAPPPLGKGIFAWVAPLWSTTEQDLITLVGLDAAIFMRFTRMCRNIFLVLTVLGCCILIPVNWTYFTPDDLWFIKVTPRNVWGDPHWATVVFAWLLTIVVCGFLWWNYKKVLDLRRQYMKSEEYQQSLHARTLMVWELTGSFRHG
ncbi:hypothetical protein VTJ49DRAFT_3509 [Mycothermus thermophilus]|uniref:CSC1/OSCA1-like N-terminal transmembrane domain-containing protein n=1 Tax=Humicola insolens TaxID=85995 RepID=A0ABR3V7J2_HUMIN